MARGAPTARAQGDVFGQATAVGYAAPAARTRARPLHRTATVEPTRSWRPRSPTPAPGAGRCALGLAGGVQHGRLKGHAPRLGIDISHLRRPHERPPDLRRRLRVARCNLPRCRLDARSGLVHPVRVRVSLASRTLSLRPRGRDGTASFWRIQVKTTSRREGSVEWVADGSPRGTTTERRYDPTTSTTSSSSTANLDYYLIPIAAVGGLRLDQPDGLPPVPSAVSRIYLSPPEPSSGRPAARRCRRRRTGRRRDLS